VNGAGLAGALAATRDQRPRGFARLRLPKNGAIIAVVVVVVIALAVLLAVAIEDLDAGAGSSSPSGGPTTYYGSIGAALATARASYWSWPASGQPSLVFAEGLASPSALGPVVNVSHLGAVSCAPTLISASAGSPATFGGLLTSGQATVWLYAFLATGNTLIVVAVVDGVSEVVATTPQSGGCYNGPGSFSTVVVDSSVAAGSAGATNASTKFFAAAAANSTVVSAEFFLAPPGYVTPAPMGEPMWVLTDTTCPLYGGASATTGTAMTSLVNAGTGALYSQKTAPVSC
jgi:hypothetical protein